MKWLCLLMLMCLLWENAHGEQSFALNDFKITSWFLLNRDGPSVDKKTVHEAFHITHHHSLPDSELTEKIGLLVNPAIHVLTASAVAPTSFLALLYKSDAHAEQHAHHELAFCITAAPAANKRAWAVADNLPYPLDCEPLAATGHQQACRVRLDLNREHQVLAISGARFDSECTQQLLLKTVSESPITKMAVVNYSRITDRQDLPDQDRRKIQQPLTGPFNPAALPLPLGESREKLLLSGGSGGWDDFHDQGRRRRPPWVFMQLPKLQVILPGVPFPSLFYNAGASEDQNQELPAGWSVDSQQNMVTVHFEMNGAVHQLDLELDDWELLVQHGIARSPNLLYRAMVSMLRYQGQRKQLLAELDWFLDQDNEQSFSLVAGILNELTELPPDHLLLKTSLAELMVPTYEGLLRQEAGWTLQKEYPASSQWLYFNALKTLVGLLSQRSVAAQALNTLWNSEGKRLILSPVGALTQGRLATLLSGQINQIAHNIMDYFEAPFRQAPGWNSNNQPSGNGAEQPPSETSSPRGSQRSSGGGFQTPGGSRNGEDKEGDDGGEDRKRGAGQNKALLTNQLTCSECHQELTEEDVQRLSRPGKKQSFDKLLCQTCENKKRPSTFGSLSLGSMNSFDAALAARDSSNDDVDTRTLSCSLIPFLFRGQNRVTREQLKAAIKTSFLQELEPSYSEFLSESVLNRILRVGLPLVKEIPVAIPTENGVATEVDIIKWFVNSVGARKLMAKAATGNQYKSVIKHLLDKGMNVDSRYHGRTPLHIALKHLDHARDVAFLLIESGADLNASFDENDPDNYQRARHTPLTLIAGKNDAELFGKMLESGMSLNDDLYPTFSLISSTGDLDSFKMLVNHVTKNLNGKMLLNNGLDYVFFQVCLNVIASPYDSPDFIKAAAQAFSVDLSKNDLSPGRFRHSYELAFSPWQLTIRAARYGKPRILKFLLGYDYFKNNINKRSYGTALDNAIRNKSTECIRLIKEKGGVSEQQILQAARKLSRQKVTNQQSYTDPADIAAAALIAAGFFAVGWSGGDCGGGYGGGFSSGGDYGGDCGGGYGGGFSGGGDCGGGYGGGFSSGGDCGSGDCGGGM